MLVTNEDKKKNKIMIVDDDPDICVVLSEVFKYFCVVLSEVFN
jgi:hypothetical protein